MYYFLKEHDGKLNNNFLSETTEPSNKGKIWLTCSLNVPVENPVLIRNPR